LGGQIRSRHRKGGPKSLHFANFTILSLLFLPPRRGPNSIANFDGGPWPDLPPLDPPLNEDLIYLKKLSREKVLLLWHAVGKRWPDAKCLLLWCDRTKICSLVRVKRSAPLQTKTLTRISWILFALSKAIDTIFEDKSIPVTKTSYSCKPKTHRFYDHDKCNEENNFHTFHGSRSIQIYKR